MEILCVPLEQPYITTTVQYLNTIFSLDANSLRFWHTVLKAELESRYAAKLQDILSAFGGGELTEFLSSFANSRENPFVLLFRRMQRMIGFRIRRVIIPRTQTRAWTESDVHSV
jgi:hypothetical protein